jgi:Chaperone of endosialidase
MLIKIQFLLVQINGVLTFLCGGPFVYSIYAHFGGNIFVSNSIFNASDRRLKDDINDLDIDLDHYLKIKPVSYKYKNENNKQLGFIAQTYLKYVQKPLLYLQMKI